MALMIQFSFAQEKTITGTVTSSEDGLPVPGASVIIEGTTRGVQTDFDGKYSLRANAGETIVFSYLGNKTVRSVVGASNVIDIVMEPDAAALDEVVVTGYASKSIAKVSGSVATVQSKDLEQVPLASFEQILQGRAPGLEIRSGSGQPGSQARIRIRGTVSINGNNQPLVVLDGIPIDNFDLSSLNANDFDSVSVLKDAQASSLYGSRAAAGVIVITSKRGKEGKARFTYRSQVGFSEAPDQNFEVLNAAQFLGLNRTIGGNNLTDEEIATQAAAFAENPGDLRDAAFRTANSQTHELSASGGSENINFFTSLNYFDQEGILDNTDLQRLSSRLNLDVKATDKLKFGINTLLTFTRTNTSLVEGAVNLNNPILIPFLGNPTVPLTNPDGTLNTGGALANVAPRSLEAQRTSIEENEGFRLNISGTAEYAFTDNISLIERIGVDFIDNFFVRSVDPTSQVGLVQAIGGAGSQFESSDRDVRFTNTTQLRYQNTFAEKHSLSVSGFVEFTNRNFRSSNFTGFGIEPTLFGFAGSVTPGTNVGGANGNGNGLIPTVGGAVAQNALFSLFASASYDYDNKYGVDVSVRRDESSRLLQGNNDAVFYSVAGRWNLDQEKWLQDVSWISSLKLRANYGTTGNDTSSGQFAFINQLGLTNFEGNRVLFQGGIANPAIDFEFTEQVNLGLDFGFFNNRITGSAEIYQRDTSDLIIPFTLAAAFGDGAVNVNTGELTNKGFEGSFSVDVVRNNDVTLNIFANAAYNDNEVTDLGQVNEFEQGTSIIRVGERLGSQFVVEFAGVNPSNGEPLYRDINGNITNVFNDGADSRTGFGSSEPRWTGGFGFNFNWKGLEISSLFNYIAGGFSRFNNVSFFTENFNFFPALNQDVRVLDVFQNPGDITDIAAPNFQRQFSSQDIEDAAFLRLRNVTVAYNIPDTFLGNSGISGARIYVRGINLATFTRFRGLDPEDGNNIAQFEFPNPVQFTAGVEFNF